MESSGRRKDVTILIAKGEKPSHPPPPSIVQPELSVKPYRGAGDGEAVELLGRVDDAAVVAELGQAVHQRGRHGQPPAHARVHEAAVALVQQRHLRRR
jgi:hypothetical protein